MYGNTRAVAEAIGEGWPDDLDLLVVGGPTQIHGMTTAFSRRLAISATEGGARRGRPRRRRGAGPGRLAARSARRARMQGRRLRHPLERPAREDRSRVTRDRPAAALGRGRLR